MAIAARDRALTLAALLLVPLAAEAPIVLGRALPASFNPGGSDLLLQFLPHRKVLWDALAHGGWPMWSAAFYGGYPLLASLQAGLCDPLTLPCALLPTVSGLGLFLLLHRLVAVGGAYALARYCEQSRTGAAAAALVFAYSGFFVGHVLHLDVFACASFTPLILLGLLRLTAPGARVRDGLVAALALAWAFDGGNPQQFAYTGVLAVVALLVASPDGLAARARTFARALPALALWPLLVLPQLLPALAYLPQSSRPGALTVEEILGSSFPLRALPGLCWGWAWGSLTDGTHQFVHGQSFWPETTVYAGVLAPWAFLAAWFCPAPRRERAVLVAGLVALLVALGPATPVGVAWAHLPGIALFRGLFRAMLFVELALALAIGRALTHLGTRPAAALVLAALCVLDVVHFAVRERGDLPAAEYMAPPRVAALLPPAGQWRRTFTLEAGRLQGAAYREGPGMDAAVHLAAREELFPATGALWGIPALGGFSGMGERRADAIADLAWEVRGDRLPPVVARILSVMGVTDLLSPRALADPDLERAGEVTAWADHRVFIYRVRRTLGPGLVVPRARVLPGGHEVLGAMSAPAFDPRAEVLIESGDPAPAGRVAVPVRTLALGANAIDVELAAPATGWLLLPFSYDPSWSATADGAALPVLRADFNALAIPLARPVARVSLTYRPAGLVPGLAVTSPLLVALLIGISATRAR